MCSGVAGTGGKAAEIFMRAAPVGVEMESRQTWRVWMVEYSGTRASATTDHTSAKPLSLLLCRSRQPAIIVDQGRHAYRWLMTDDGLDHWRFDARQSFPS